MVLCFTDSSGESESSDDSDIDGETASALFMVISVPVAAYGDVDAFPGLLILKHVNYK